MAPKVIARGNRGAGATRDRGAIAVAADRAEARGRRRRRARRTSAACACGRAVGGGIYARKGREQRFTPLRTLDAQGGEGSARGN